MLLDAQKPLPMQAAASGAVTAEMRQLMQYNPETGAITFHHGGADPAFVRAFIRGMAHDLNALPCPQLGLPVDQIALNGMIVRTMHIPKGQLLVGKVHKLDCINIVSKGSIELLTEHGSGRMVAGDQAVSPAGTQKMGYANEDTTFINIFRCDETSIDAIEDAIAWSSYEAFDCRAQPAIEGEK